MVSPALHRAGIVGEPRHLYFRLPGLEGYNDNKDEFYLLVLIAAWAGSCWRMQTIWRLCSSVLNDLFAAVWPGRLRFPPETFAEASIKYTILSAAASSFLLFGWRWCMRSLATCRLSRWVKTSRRYAQRAAVAGRFRPDDCWLGFKLSLVPFHLWTPDVYQGRLRRFPLSWRRRAKSLSSVCDASVPLRTGG